MRVLPGGVAPVLISFLALALVGVFGLSHAAHAAITGIEISPDDAVVTSDDTVEYTVVAVDGATKTDITDQVLFSENDPFGSFKNDQNPYSAGKVGTWLVQVNWGGFVDQTTVTVKHGTLAELTVNPNSGPERITIGGTRTFTADGFDLDNNMIAEIEPTWSVKGDIGTIDERTGAFTATTAGEGMVVASVENISAAISVTVEEAPAAANANAPGEAESGSAGNTTDEGRVLAAETEGTNENVNAGEENTPGEAGNENTISSADEEDAMAMEETDEACTTYDWWVWVLGILVYLALLIAYYNMVKTRSDLVIWLVPLVLTGGALWAFFALTCAGHFLWVPWVTVIGGLLVTLFRPRSFMPENGSRL